MHIYISYGLYVIHTHTHTHTHTHVVDISLPRGGVVKARAIDVTPAATVSLFCRPNDKLQAQIFWAFLFVSKS